MEVDGFRRPPSRTLPMFSRHCEGYDLTTLHTLASGSSGNALVISCGGTHLLVDAGISCRRITAGLRELGLVPEDLTAVLITHTHADHVSGLQTLLKHTACPICAGERVCRELAYRYAGIEARLLPLPLCRPWTLGEAEATVFPTSHDAPGSCGFRLDTPFGGIGILTPGSSRTRRRTSCRGWTWRCWRPTTMSRPCAAVPTPFT